MVAFTIPPSIEAALRRAFGDDLNRVAREALAIEAYRSGRLTAAEVATLLGLETSIQAQEWLGHRGAARIDSFDDLYVDRAARARLAPEMARRGSPDSILRLAGTLTEDEAERILKAAEECRRIDPALWNGG